MYTKLTASTTATTGVSTTDAQTIFEVGKFNPGVKSAKIKDVIVSAQASAGETTDQVLSLQAVASDGTVITLAKQINFQAGTAGSFSFATDLGMGVDRNINNISKLQIAIGALTADQTYGYKAIVNYE